MSYFVEATGPEIEDLQVGQQVLMMGKLGEDIAPLPLAKNLFITKQVNVLVVIEKTNE